MWLGGSYYVQSVYSFLPCVHPETSSLEVRSLIARGAYSLGLAQFSRQPGMSGWYFKSLLPKSWPWVQVEYYYCSTPVRLYLELIGLCGLEIASVSVLHLILIAPGGHATQCTCSLLAPRIECALRIALFGNLLLVLSIKTSGCSILLVSWSY